MHFEYTQKTKFFIVFLDNQNIYSMILIADAGSTKTRWVLVNNERMLIGKFESAGLNPTVFDEETLSKNIARNTQLLNYAGYIKEIYFYGSGLDDEESYKKMNKVLSELFDKAQINLYSDMLAAARATAGKESGIISIIGTGSNSGFYDGEKYTETIGYFGYLLMDDASGNWFGKQLLRDYFYKKMPENISKKFKQEYKIDEKDILTKIYHKPQPNTFLATFSPFMSKHYKSDYIKNLLTRGFTIFVEEQLSAYEQYRDVPLHFNGSIAYFFQKELLEVLKKNNLKVGKIIQDPVEELIDYHL